MLKSSVENVTLRTAHFMEKLEKPSETMLQEYLTGSSNQPFLKRLQSLMLWES